jgi:tRNA U34 5-carboxymethylaminomethyl modifying GTPase MnmE/TrmE
MERKARLKREGSLLQQIESHANEFEDRWETERVDRLERIARLEEQVNRQEAQRTQEQESFQRKVQEGLEALRQELEDEVQEREKEDEEIVSALNRYTQQLQQSLSILSAD